MRLSPKKMMVLVADDEAETDGITKDAKHTKDRSTARGRRERTPRESESRGDRRDSREAEGAAPGIMMLSFVYFVCFVMAQ